MVQDGWDQNGIVYKNGKPDGEGLTVGAWSITQRSNFDMLAKYMEEEGIDAVYVNAVKDSHGKGGADAGKYKPNRRFKNNRRIYK